MSSVQGVDNLIARLEALGQTKPILRAAQIKTVAEAQKLVPRKTGFLQRNIRPGAITETTAQVIVPTPYAAAIEGGSGLYGPKHKKYEIRGKHGNALFFPSQKALVERLGVGQSNKKGKFRENRLAFTKGGRLTAGSNRRFGNAAYVHAMVVHHPGVHAQPYLMPGAKKAVAHFRDLLVARWNEAA